MFVVAAVSASRRNTLNTNANVTIEGQLRSRRKAAKMLVAVVIMFAGCYFPVHVLSILRYVEITKVFSRKGNGLFTEMVFKYWSRDALPQLTILELSLYTHLPFRTRSFLPILYALFSTETGKVHPCTGTEGLYRSYEP